MTGEGPKPIWKQAVSQFGISELKTRSEDLSKFVIKNPDWDDALKLMGR